MAKDIKRHISHLKSSGTTVPAAADLVYGEIAVGYGAGNEVLYIKNSSDNVIPFVNGASALAEAEAYADSGDVTSVTGDTEITVPAQKYNPVSDIYIEARYIHHELIHAYPADDGQKLSVYQHFSFTRKASGVSVAVSYRHCCDGALTLRHKRSSIAYRRALRNLLYMSHMTLNGHCG